MTSTYKPVLRAFAACLLAIGVIAGAIACSSAGGASHKLGATGGGNAVLQNSQITYLGTFAGDASMPATWVAQADAAGATKQTARAVITALPGTYTGTGTGILTGSAAGAIAAQNGVTFVAGDVAFLAPGATNIASDGGTVGSIYDEGPYVVTNSGAILVDGGSTSKFVLTRPSWWAHRAPIQVGAAIVIGGEDTLFGGSEWYSYAAKGGQVDVNDPIFYPNGIGEQVTLTIDGGIKTISNFPLRSATKSVVIGTLEAVAGDAGSTVGYEPFVITPGYLGTASVIIKAVKAGGTVNTRDNSTVNVRLSN